MSDLFEETKSDYVEMKKLEYFKKAIPFVVIGTILIIASMLLNSWMHNRKEENNQKIGDMFVSSIQSNDKDLLDESLSFIINDNSTAMSDIARLVAIQKYLHAQDSDNLLLSLKKISQESKNHLTRDYAKLLSMNIMIDKKELSEQETKDMMEYISYFNNDTIPFYGSASLINALYKVRTNNIEDAKMILRNLLASKKTPRIVQDQANSILSNLL